MADFASVFFDLTRKMKRKSDPLSNPSTSVSSSGLPLPPDKKLTTIPPSKQQNENVTPVAFTQRRSPRRSPSKLIDASHLVNPLGSQKGRPPASERLQLFASSPVPPVPEISSTNETELCKDDFEYEVEVRSEEGHESIHETTDEDIYGDLESSIFMSTAKKPLVSKEVEEQLNELLKERVTWKEEVKRLTKENKAYSTNISSLYRTAKNEIDKKNYIIKQLQEKLKKLAMSAAQRASVSKKEVEEILKNCQEAYNEAHSHVILNEIKQTLDQMKIAKSSGKKKQYKFGNMSLYFSRQQASFTRTTPVTFLDSVPAKISTNGKLESSDGSKNTKCDKPEELAPEVSSERAPIVSSNSVSTERKSCDSKFLEKPPRTSLNSANCVEVESGSNKPAEVLSARRSSNSADVDKSLGDGSNKPLESESSKRPPSRNDRRSREDLPDLKSDKRHNDRLDRRRDRSRSLDRSRDRDQKRRRRDGIEDEPYSKSYNSRRKAELPRSEDTFRRTRQRR